MKSVSAAIVRIAALPFVSLAGIASLHAQFVQLDLRDTTSQADYVIVSPPLYLSTLDPLASFRSTFNGFDVVIALTDSINSQFGQGIKADSALRAFITYSLTEWEDPKPVYFLLAGNVNLVSSHKEPGLVGIEDSIMVDQWLVEGAPDTATFVRPAAAIGRLPAWNQSQLDVMVAKTLQYESTSDSSWTPRSLTIADYDPDIGTLYEPIARTWQQLLAPVWNDTVTGHLREDSPLHMSREDFESAVNQGTAWVSLLGYNEWNFFSKSMWFTTWDAESLANVDRLPLWIFSSSQRFEREDTVCVSVALLQLSHRGAVATFGPTGHTFVQDYFSFANEFVEEMAGHPTASIGANILSVKRRAPFPYSGRKATLLGDPALVIKNPIVASVRGSEGGLPEDFVLHQNYPNPFNPETTIRIDVARSSFVTLKLYDLLGQELVTIVNDFLSAGTHTYRIDSRGLHLSSGVYFYRMRSNGLSYTRKMVVLR